MMIPKFQNRSPKYRWSYCLLSGIVMLGLLAVIGGCSKSKGKSTSGPNNVLVVITAPANGTQLRLIDLLIEDGDTIAEVITSVKGGDGNYGYTFTWTREGGRAHSAFGQEDTFNIIIEGRGRYTLKVTVIDGDGLKGTDTVVFDVI